MENQNWYNSFSFFFKSKKFLFFFFIHRSSIRHWKKGWALLVNSSNYFIDMSVLYQINSTLAISRLKNFETNTNVVVERVPLFAQTSSSLALTVLMVSHYWSIENQSKFTNESRNAMVLPYDFWSYSEVIRRDRAPFLIYPKKY